MGTQNAFIPSKYSTESFDEQFENDFSTESNRRPAYELEDILNQPLLKAFFTTYIIEIKSLLYNKTTVEIFSKTCSEIGRYDCLRFAFKAIEDIRPNNTNMFDQELEEGTIEDLFVFGDNDTRQKERKCQNYIYSFLTKMSEHPKVAEMLLNITILPGDLTNIRTQIVMANMFRGVFFYLILTICTS